MKSEPKSDSCGILLNYLWIVSIMYVHVYRLILHGEKMAYDETDSNTTKKSLGSHFAMNINTHHLHKACKLNK